MAHRIDAFLKLVAEQRASDLHLHAGNVPLARLDGDLVPLPFRKLSPEETRKFLFEIMSPEQRAIFEREQELDLSYTVDGVGRFRGNVFQQSRGMGAVFRVISTEIPTLEELALPRVLRKLALLQNGLVLVSGPTGSGKTTTLAAIVHEINRTSQKHIITIEDPIEYVHEPLESVVTQRQVGVHTDSFASALRSALREAPDVVVIGELRDAETAALALSAAETGVLVFGTVHTNSAAKSIDRLIDVCPEEMHGQVRATLGTLLRGVVAQQLIKRAAGDGRIAAIEILLPSYALSHMIREGKIHQIDAYIQANEGDSEMQSLDSVLAHLVELGTVDLEDAERVARDVSLVRRAALRIEE